MPRATTQIAETRSMALNWRQRERSPRPAIDISNLLIQSPKRNHRLQRGWEGFFPYYAGYPEAFAEALLKSAKLPASSRVLDPWNGSGTTTYAASTLGLDSVGIDLNPVMAVVARARSLASSEADSLVPIGRELIVRADAETSGCRPDDPLLRWFGPRTSSRLRRLEQAARGLLLGERTMSDEGVNFDNISAIASTFYVALFALVQELAAEYRTSNPTWIRYPKGDERRAGRSATGLRTRYISIIEEMAAALEIPTATSERGQIEIRVADTADGLDFGCARVDFVLTSPPYCTRIDYTAATRTQLAVLWPLLRLSAADLSLRMMGSIRVPQVKVSAREEWGPTCNEFLRKLAAHPSKASSTYYLNTHLDYFAKMQRSMRTVSDALADQGVAVMVVQDSHYKEIHNDLPVILSEMALEEGLHLRRRQDFLLARTLAGSHPHSRSYRKELTATEAVLCFEKT